MKDLIRFFQLAPDKIVELIFLLEGEDGMGVVRTLDSDRGLIEILLAPDFEKDFNEFLGTVQEQLGVREIEKPEGVISIGDD
jgi:hypothetical protein